MCEKRSRKIKKGSQVNRLREARRLRRIQVLQPQRAFHSSGEDSQPFPTPTPNPTAISTPNPIPNPFAILNSNPTVIPTLNPTVIPTPNPNVIPTPTPNATPTPNSNPTAFDQKEEHNRVLIDLAWRTVDLMQKNQQMQKKIVALKKEAAEFVTSVMSHPENKKRYFENLRQCGLLDPNLILQYESPLVENQDANPNTAT